MRKNSFVIYHDMRGPLEMLSDEERGRLLSAVFAYSEDGTEPEFTGALLLAFAFVRSALDRDAAAWADKVQKRREAGSAGGKQCAAKRANASFASPGEAEAANQAEPVPVPEPEHEHKHEPGQGREGERGRADKPPRQGRFRPPTLEEVSAYCLERGSGVDPRRFLDFYEAKGWMIGRQRMKDWKAALRTWESRDGPQRSPVPSDADYARGW